LNLPAERLRVFVGQMDWVAVALLHHVHPEQDDVDAVVWLEG
jgi:hypothetical protein